ncbi:MAG: hypothetical protein V7K69_26425 [Nostoc sp.]|uniref:hypothetical protein n=1 Tax=Nostoc sp. TaxID=1180 RepID=UPI002FFCBEDC
MESSKKIFGSFFELFTEEAGEQGAGGRDKYTGITLSQGLEEQLNLFMLKVKVFITPTGRCANEMCNTKNNTSLLHSQYIHL